MGTVGGVWVFTDSAGAGVEVVEELANATGMCRTVRGRPVRVCEKSVDRPVSGLWGRTDSTGLAELDFTPVHGRFLR